MKMKILEYLLFFAENNSMSNQTIIMFTDTGTMLKFVLQLSHNVQEVSCVGSQGQKRSSDMLDVQT